MQNINDLYTFNVSTPITEPAVGDEQPTQIGMSIISYEVRRYWDLRNQSTNLAYQVLCTHRIVIPNATAYIPGPVVNAGFTNYPAVITNCITIANDSNNVILTNYSPRTLNSAVQTSNTAGTGASANTSIQHTSGSSTSQSNSFGASASIGTFGGSVSVDYNHSWGSDTSESASKGGDKGNNSEQSSSDSMSIKDWGSYCYLDNGNTSPTWIWGQEYPWNVIQFQNCSTVNNTTITLPSFVQALLTDGIQAFPPSQLSLFGIDFTMKAVWILEIGDGVLTPASTEVTLTHTINYCTATHTLPNESNLISATLNDTISCPPYTSMPFDLCLYGLDPVSNKPAIIGFIPSKFIIPPASGNGSVLPTPFTITSGTNNLLIKDTSAYINGTIAGFTASEGNLSAAFDSICGSLQMTINFKIIDNVNDYNLYLKHWVTDSSGVTLTFTINGDTQNAITKYVTALEAQGGESNLLSIALRNQNFSSVDYHDYLQLGLNSIEITITPVSSDLSVAYQIRAISIEKN